MKKILIKIFIAIFIIVSTGISLNSHPISASPNGLYYFDSNNLFFDLDGLQFVYSTNQNADIRFQSSGSAWYLDPMNTASIKDLGSGNFDNAIVPDSGYTVERASVITDHIYAVHCGNGSYGLILITSYDNNQGNAEFMARAAEPAKKLDLYYLSGDFIRFDMETMKNVYSSQESDLYFRYSKTTFMGENGASIKDLGEIDYGTAKAPVTGYSNEEFKITKDHVYAIRNKMNYYVIKVTNVVSESDAEFLARVAEVGSNTDPGDGANPGDGTNPDDGSTPGDHLTDRAVLTDLYWVENDENFIYCNKILFSDSKGILDPFLSPNKKYVIYTNGSYNLYMYDISKKKKSRIYSYSDPDYGVYPVGWSQDSKQIALMTSYKKSYNIGGNRLYVLTISSKETSAITKGLSSADWGKNSKFAISNGKSVWLVDKQGRNKITLKVPTAAAYYGPDNVSITSDSKKVIYTAAGRYYLHDIATNKYKELPIPEEAVTNGTIRAGKSGRFAVIQNSKIYIFDPTDQDYALLYEGKESSFPNWVKP